MSIVSEKVLPNLLRALQQENNCGECSHMNSSLYFRGIANTVVTVSKYISIFMVEWVGALAIYRNSLILKASYVGVDFRGGFASASLKPDERDHRTFERPDISEAVLPRPH